MITNNINLNMFLGSLKNYDQKFRQDVIKLALIQVAQQIVTDTSFIVPKDEGTLTGSGNIAIKGFSNIRPMGVSKSPLETEPDRSGLKDFEVRVSYNTGYAKKVHENYKDMTPGIKSIQKLGEDAANVGYKFLEKTVNKNVDKYINLLESRMIKLSKEMR